MTTKRQLRESISINEALAAMRTGPDDDISDVIDAELARLKSRLARKATS